LKASDSFVKVKVLSNDGSQARVEVVKSLGGLPTASEITVEDFFLLRIFSRPNGDSVKLPLTPDKTYYLFLKKDPDKNSYRLPTPTAGIAPVSGTDVVATYRHSYHQAVVPEDVYAKTMQAIFEGSNGRSYDEAFVAAFLKEQLGQPPSNWSGENDPVITKRFFLQHVALETFYHLHKGADLAMLTPFLSSNSPHEQISACRAIGRIRSPESQELMMAFVERPHDGFAKVMCVWGLGEQDAKGITSRLDEFLKTESLATAKKVITDLGLTPVSSAAVLPDMWIPGPARFISRINAMLPGSYCSLGAGGRSREITSAPSTAI